MTSSNLWRLPYFITFFCFTSLLLTLGCKNSEPIKIGFSSGLTGRMADLGIYGRNGTMLAVEEANQQGGINGRPVELLIRDDKHDPEIANQVDQQLIDEGVVAIIGHMTSSMSVAVQPLINKNSILLFSPTTATNKLTGLDDNFIRVMPPNKTTISSLANYVMDERKVRRTVVVYDDQNRAFSKEWADLFEEHAAAKNLFAASIPFAPGPGLSFEKLHQQIISHTPDGVLIVAAALDAAMICQQIRKAKGDLPLFTTMWSMSDDFLQHGGTSTEGVTFINWFDPDHPSAASIDFRKRYTDRFGRKPTFASHFAYETAAILLNALHNSDTTGQLKNTILQKGSFDGTQGKIHIDRYGDAERPLFLMTVSNGKFKRIE